MLEVAFRLPTLESMGAERPSILFLGKQGDVHTEQARATCETFGTVTACLGEWGDPLPDAARDWSGDYVVSYLSRWVVPRRLLERAARAAINFHPASPEYPGIGCVNFALYESASEYGATCHHMEPRVDTGSIIAVKRFPVQADDSVATLLARTYAHQHELFQEIAGCLAAGEPLPRSREKWTRAPFTRRQFEALTRIRPDMDAAEVARRIRATSFGAFRPELELHGHRFVYSPPEPPADKT
jgi:methionyl-tRNA formyltransferase